MRVRRAAELRRVDAGVIGVLAIAAVIAVLLFAAPLQVLTGDEPRYLMYAVSIWRNGTFQMSLPDWKSLYSSVTHAETSGLPVGANGLVLLNGVYLPTLLAPIAGIFSLAGLRAVALLAGLIGLFHLFRLCRRTSGTQSALLATAVAELSIPLLPYLHLFYMEAFLFAFVCCAWDRLQAVRRNWGGDAITAIVILAIPFAHMRGSVVAAALYLMLLWQLYRRGATTRAAVLAGLAAAALTLLIVLNLGIYGAVAGPVNSARPPMPWELFPVLAMQLFNVHHGLLAYAPVWLLGFAGLWIAAMRGPSVARQGFVLAIVAAVTSIGVNPGECWPARFWVLSIPMLAVGLSTWWAAERRLLPRLIGVGLIGFTLVNTVIFLPHPNDFLENRQTTATYQSLFNKTGHVHFGLGLPVEVDDPYDRDTARDLAIGAGVLVLLMVLSAQRRRSIYAVLATLMLAVVVDLARVGIVPPSEYRSSISHDRFVIEFARPMASGYMQFGRYWETWFTPPDWQKFKVDLTAVDGRRFGQWRSANQVIAASCSGDIGSIAIESPTGFDIGFQANERLIVYRSNSTLRASGRWISAMVPIFRRPC